MFSGKTEELIRRMKRAEFAKQRVEIFKPAVDTRYDETKVVSHDSNAIRSTPVPSSSNILILAEGVEVVGVDEAQFFDDGSGGSVQSISRSRSTRYCSRFRHGLPRNPFGPIPNLMATAEYVTKVHAICMQCGDLANHSHRFEGSDSLVELGEKESYEPLCRRCFTKEKEANHLKMIKGSGASGS